MNKLIILIVSIVTLYSCGTIKEEIWIYPDNKIKFDLTMEMGKNMSKNFGKIVAGMLFPNANLNDTTINFGYSGNLSFYGIPINNKEEQVDTIVYLKDSPDIQYDSIRVEIKSMNKNNLLSPQEEEEFAQLLFNFIQGISIRASNNIGEYFLAMTIHFPVTSMDDLNTLGENLKRMAKDSTDTKFNAPENFLFTVEKNVFKRGNLLLDQNIFDFGGSDNETTGFLSKMGNFMKMKEVISTVHFPRKALSVKNPLSVISDDKKSVTIRLSAEDIKQGKSIENVIKFK